MNIYTSNPFGYRGFFKGEEKGLIKIYCKNNKQYYVNKVLKNEDEVLKYKICMSKTDKKSRCFLLEANEIVSETFLLLYTTYNKEEAENFLSYTKTKLFKFLLYLSFKGILISSINFKYIPAEDYSKTITDAYLYKKYNINEEEIKYIEEIVNQL